ncbi:hypothetical protein LTR66_003056 [Elasticomyces elasticus]|nr:hypothetical protein LTR28_000438 [Elasticomyces elasticus]KAK4997540.1 hypothetical protein LTR66_003056 [Elasticomyces elasticus]
MPLTDRRTIAAAAVLLSITCWLVPGPPDPFAVIFIRPYILTLKRIPQLWRLVTPFFLTGPKLGLVLDPYFLYTYSSQLEIASARFSQAGDFFVYLVFIFAIVLLTAGFALQAPTFLSALTLAFTYTYAQDNPTKRLTFFIITFQAKYLPFAMLLMTFVMDSPWSAIVQATGLVAAHLYDFLSRIWPTFAGGTNVIKTPMFVRRWFEKPGASQSVRGFGTAFSARPASGTAQSQTQGRTTGWTSGFGGGMWGSRGQGRRLGGD